MVRREKSLFSYRGGSLVVYELTTSLGSDVENRGTRERHNGPPLPSIIVNASLPKKRVVWGLRYCVVLIHYDTCFLVVDLAVQPLVTPVSWACIPESPLTKPAYQRCPKFFVPE